MPPRPSTAAALSEKTLLLTVTVAPGASINIPPPRPSAPCVTVTSERLTVMALRT